MVHGQVSIRIAEKRRLCMNRRKYMNKNEVIYMCKHLEGNKCACSNLQDSFANATAKTKSSSDSLFPDGVYINMHAYSKYEDKKYQ
jgi:hypothetical protein